MRYVILFCCVLLTIPTIATQEKQYDRKYDLFDIETLVQNPRLLRKYMDCFLDQGPCTPIGRVFKLALPEIIITRCGKCTPAQKSFARRTFDAFKRELPEQHAELKKLLDPNNKYYDSFEKAVASA
ncbi:unnamed protein product [Diatraea saccharalis]|uniref:Uncharacterized protein n=1 Tax=Diatraea saccharalis TaxID=40085 RepID=A0A9N9RFK2_9NEOP|nr:unnamed protein product [Diatraea saccharalis]